MRIWVNGSLGAAIFFVLGCESSPVETVPDGKIWQAQTTASFVEHPVAELVLVVDDVSSAEAASLRLRVTEVFRSRLEQMLINLLPCGDGLDSALARTMEIRIVVVHPSVPGSAKAIGPSDDTDLAYRSDHASVTDAASLVDETARVMNDLVAPAGAPYLPLDAAMQTMSLLLGDRPPSDDREAKLVFSMAAPLRFMGLVIASTRDDEGTAPIKSYETTSLDRQLGWYYATFLAQDANSCTALLDKTTRLGQAPILDYASQRCDDVEYPFSFIESARRGCFPYCFTAPLAVLASGGVACTLTVTRANLDPCPIDRAWFDPKGIDGVRRPLVIDEGYGPRRVCEIRQLEGDALEGCRTKLDCPDCGDGWCRTASVELGAPLVGAWRRPACGSRLRFVGHAMPDEPASVTEACNLQY